MGSAPAVGLFPSVQRDLLGPHALGLLGLSPAPLHSTAKQEGHRAACPGDTGTCCGFSPACLHAQVAPSSRNRLSTLQTGFSHNPEHVTEKSNNKHILLNSQAPSAFDLPDGPWQPTYSGKGWLAFLQLLRVRGPTPVCAQPPGVAEGCSAELHAG